MDEEAVKAAYKAGFAAGENAAKELKAPPPRGTNWQELAKEWKVKGKKLGIQLGGAGALFGSGWLWGSPERDEILSKGAGLASLAVVIVLGFIGWSVIKEKVK